MRNTQDLLKALGKFKKTPESFGLQLRLNLSEIILTQLGLKGWTQKRLAEEVGVKEPVITRMVHADQNCTLDSVARVLFALGVRAKLVEERAHDVLSPPQSVSGKTFFSFAGESHGKETIFTCGSEKRAS